MLPSFVFTACEVHLLFCNRQEGCAQAQQWLMIVCVSALQQFVVFAKGSGGTHQLLLSAPTQF